MRTQERIPAKRVVRALGVKEANIHKALVAHLELRCKREVFWFHIPNGEARAKITGAMLRAMGVKRGVPDLQFLYGGFAYFLELKREGGTLSPEQRRVHDEIRAAGAIVAVAYGLDNAIHCLNHWNMLR